MDYRLTIEDSQGSWAVLTNTPEGKIGHLYTFEPLKAIIVEDAYDEADIHYCSKLKAPIPKDTEVIVDSWLQNFYGCYFRISYNGEDYDVKPQYIKIEKE